MFNQTTIPKRLIRILLLSVAVIILAGSGTVRAQEPDCLEVSPDSLHFFANMSDPYYGITYADTQAILIDACEEDVNWQINPDESWIGVDKRSGMGTDSFKVWIVWSGLPDIINPPPANDTMYIYGNVIIEAYEIPDSVHFVHITLGIYWEGDSLALVVEPSSLEYTAEIDEIIEGSVYVSEAHGEEILFEYHSNADWLIVPYYFAPLFTPSDAIFNINTAGLSPGNYNSSLVFQGFSDQGGQPLSVVYIPVNLTVTVTDSNYYVETMPEFIEKPIFAGDAAYDSLYIYEILGRNVPFQFSNLSDWLTVEAYAMPPYTTPLSLSLLFNTENLEPGIYYDSVTIESTSEEMPFETRYVHISINVYDNPVINVSPESFHYELEQGEILQYELYWVYEEHGAHINFTNRSLNQSGWLMLPERSVWTTPDSVPFAVSAEYLDQGIYTDSILLLPYDPVDEFDTVIIPVILEVNGIQSNWVAVPDYFEFYLNEGDDISHISLAVFKDDGSQSGFTVRAALNSPWLDLGNPSGNQYITPDTVLFNIITDGLLPGAYADTIFIVDLIDDSLIHLKVPIVIFIDSATEQVIALPDYFNLTVNQGESIYNLGLWVYDAGGEMLPYTAVSGLCSSWVQIHPPGSQYLPDSVYFDILSANLDPGIYTDTILIFNPLDDTTRYFEVKVPIVLSVEQTGPMVVHSLPDHFEFTLCQGDTLMEHFYVYEEHGLSVPFRADEMLFSNWLYVSGSSEYIVFETPDSIAFFILTGGLEPGAYSDTIIIWDPFDSALYEDVKVPVNLFIHDGSYDYTVETMPSSIEFTLPWGGTGTEQLNIFETNGETVGFTWHQNDSWLQMSFPTEPPFTTPTTAIVSAFADDTLLPGVYYDTLVIVPDTSLALFEPVHVPVTMTITDGGFICGDINGDGVVNLRDILHLIRYLFIDPPGPAPIPTAAGYITDDNQINLEDVLYLIDFIYGVPKGAPPVCPSVPE